MAIPYRPIQEPLLLSEQETYPPQVPHDYTPQSQGVSTPYPPPPVPGYPPKAYDLPPVYPALEHGPPPEHGYQPQVDNTTVVVAQPVTTTTTRVSPPEEDQSGVAVCAFVFSLLTLITCGASVICLTLSLPALILSIVALNSRGRSQKSNATISIGLNAAVVVCTVVLLVGLVTPMAVSASGASFNSRTRYCPSYYSSTYRTYCVANSYSTRGSCSYYNSSYDGYCPSTSTYSCPNFYSSAYVTHCSGYRYYSTSCGYLPSTSSYGRYCPIFVYRGCPFFYSSTYSTRCVPYGYYSISTDPCSFYASYTNGGGYCPT